MLIYLDNCCFNRPFDDQNQQKIFLETQAKLYIQQKLLEQNYKFVWSYILEYENMQNPFEIRRKSIIAWKELASDIVNASEEILTYAEKLICEKIKVKDALHIACAVYAKCQYFITTDKRLLNFKSDDILIVNPIEFINEME